MYPSEYFNELKRLPQKVIELCQKNLKEKWNLGSTAIVEDLDLFCEEVMERVGGAPECIACYCPPGACVFNNYNKYWEQFEYGDVPVREMKIEHFRAFQRVLVEYIIANMDWVHEPKFIILDYWIHGFLKGGASYGLYSIPEHLYNVLEILGSFTLFDDPVAIPDNIKDELVDFGPIKNKDFLEIITWLPIKIWEYYHCEEDCGIDDEKLAKLKRKAESFVWLRDMINGLKKSGNLHLSRYDLYSGTGIGISDDSDENFVIFEALDIISKDLGL
ncbi:MAG: hypothetical protein ACTSRA_17815 [Promethearchaeota archaeon]